MEFDNIILESNLFKLNGEYVIFDKIKDTIFNVKVSEILNDEEYIFELLDENDFDKKWIYKEINDINIISIINDNINKKDMYNNDVFTIQTNEIKGIVGRKDIIELSLINFKSLNIDNNTILISLTDPKSKLLDNSISNNFKDTISLQFSDVEEDFCNYIKMSNSQGKELLDFILKHKKDNFLIHCEYGKSRSAAVGMAIDCILNFNGNKKDYSLEPSKILNHPRYAPNMYIYNKLIELYNT